MDRTTLTIWVSAAALAMFVLGWTACWLWFRLRSSAEREAPPAPHRPWAESEPDGDAEMAASDRFQSDSWEQVDAETGSIADEPR